jgi:hypothetical protein
VSIAVLKKLKALINKLVGWEESKLEGDSHLKTLAMVKTHIYFRILLIRIALRIHMI